MYPSDVIRISTCKYIQKYIYDSFNENEHFLNNYECHKVINDVIITRNDIIRTLIKISITSFRNN